jgi:hypothetical protein
MAERFKPWQGWLEPGVTLVIAGVLFVVTSHQSRMYSDTETLYRATITRNPACWMAQVNLGNTLYQNTHIPEAMELFKQAVTCVALQRERYEKGRTSKRRKNIGTICGSTLITPRRATIGNALLTVEAQSNSRI